jgi:hypothetical protein
MTTATLARDSAIDGSNRSSAPITLGGKHFDHLAAASDQGRQFLALCVRQWPRLRLNNFGKCAST